MWWQGARGRISGARYVAQGTPSRREDSVSVDTRELWSIETVERMASEAWNSYPARPELQNVPYAFQEQKAKL